MLQSVLNPNNLLDVIRVMTTHFPLCKRGARGDLNFACMQKSPSIPLFQRGRWVELPNGLFGLNQGYPSCVRTGWFAKTDSRGAR